MGGQGIRGSGVKRAVWGGKAGTAGDAGALDPMNTLAGGDGQHEVEAHEPDVAGAAPSPHPDRTYIQSENAQNIHTLGMNGHT